MRGEEKRNVLVSVHVCVYICMQFKLSFLWSSRQVSDAHYLPLSSFSLACVPSLAILSQRCLVHLRKRCCLATSPLISRTMEPLLIVGVCVCVCVCAHAGMSERGGFSLVNT